MTTGKMEISSYVVTYTNVKTEALSFNKQKKKTAERETRSDIHILSDPRREE
jgi:hypothetical protein